SKDPFDAFTLQRSNEQVRAFHVHEMNLQFFRFLAMKWPERIAQGFSPGLSVRHDRPESGGRVGCRRFNIAIIPNCPAVRSTPVLDYEPVSSAATFRAVFRSG